MTRQDVQKAQGLTQTILDKLNGKAFDATRAVDSLKDFELSLARELRNIAKLLDKESRIGFNPK